MELSLSQLNDYINYYALHQHWKEIEILLSKTKFSQNELCIFWRGFCELQKGNSHESAIIFEQIRHHSDYNLAAISALIEAQLITQDPDHSQISKLKSNLKKLSKTVNSNQYQFYSLFKIK